MSRSYKHTWGYCDRNPWAKRQANKKVRRTANIPNGKAYRKLYCSWNISDYAFLVFRPSDMYDHEHPWRVYGK